jgi:hypothetical protein
MRNVEKEKGLGNSEVGMRNAEKEKGLGNSEVGILQRRTSAECGKKRKVQVIRLTVQGKAALNY